MKKKLRFLSIILLVTLVGALIFINKNEQKEENISVLREKHENFLKNSPFKETLQLSKEERLAKSLPPNKYYEREFELTMNPTTGFPELQNVMKLQKVLNKKRKGLTNRLPGDAFDNQWVERGPFDVGGRTRAVLFDPNDVTNETVYAGGVSGGLWVNTNISNPSSVWTRVAGVPSNMNISCITVDPRDSNTWYIGTGEQHTKGAAVGSGVYKTTDGGATWVNKPIAAAGLGNFATTSSDFFSGIYYINDIIAWDNGASTEVFVGVGGHVYGDAANKDNFLGLQSAGLYRSTNGGNSWSRIQSANMRYTYISLAFYVIPNDFEIGPDNKLWMGTIRTPSGSSTTGGRVYSSTNGTTWTLVTTLPNSNRVELEVSATNPNKLYALTEGTSFSSPVHIYATTDGFATAPTALALPDDADLDIPENDFTRGQAFYNLVIEVDPNNDNIIYAGGINLFRSTLGNATNSTTDWAQISKWANLPDLNTLSCSLVHADQHAFIFHPTDSNRAVIGCDGGVYYASSLSSASSTPTAISGRNNNYNVTQFYYGAIGPSSTNEIFVAGAQDNGTPFVEGAVAGINSTIDVYGGDGAFTEVDNDGNYMIVSYVYNYHEYIPLPYTGASYTIDDGGTEGDFINEAALDHHLNIMYSNGSSGSTSRINRYTLGASSSTKTQFTNAMLNRPPTAFAISPYTTNLTTLLVGTENAKVLRIKNANADPTWEDISGPAFVGSVSGVEYGASENEILVTFHNYGVVSVWFTNDGGVTWANKEGNLPNIPVKCILQNPITPNEVIVGTELGVWRTENFTAASPTWSQSYNGMSDVKVVDLDLRASDNTVLATTHGRGFFTGKFIADGLTASFTSDKTRLGILDVAQFTDLSENGASSWSWSFSPSTVTYQNGTNANSRNPQVKFDALGNYTVSLTIGDGLGTDAITRTNYITVGTVASNFYADITSPVASIETVTFTGTADFGPVTSWSWSFNPSTVTYQGGTNANSQNPQVTFDQEGPYEVTLTVSDGINMDSETKSMYVIATDHCIPTTSGGCLLDGVKNFVLGTISNPSGCGFYNGSLGYSDFRNFTTDIDLNPEAQAGIYTLTVSSNFEQERVSIWVDFNDNHLFEPSEQLLSNGLLSTISDTDFQLNFPNSAPFGQHTLRVKAINPSGIGTDVNDPCGSVEFGESEDYTVNIISSQTLSLNLVQQYGISIYPTVVESSIFIKAYKNLENVEIEVFSLSGKKVYSEKTSLVSRNEKEIPLDNLSKGMYFLRFKTESGKETLKFIKK